MNANGKRGQLDTTGLDILRDWRNGPFRLLMWDTGRLDIQGRTVIGYALSDNGQTIFQGADFRGSPRDADDSNNTLAALLTFLSLRPGDIDCDYFDGYSPRQLDWAEESGEALAMLAEELRLSPDWE
jgi:hypothetical protein